MKKNVLVIAVILLAICVIGLLFYRLQIVNFSANSNLTFREVNFNQLESNVQEWIKINNEFGVYIYKYKKDANGINKYLIYSKKDITYDYHTAKIKLKDKILNIKIFTDDEQVKISLFMSVETKVEPEQIKLYVDNKETKFKNEFVEK